MSVEEPELDSSFTGLVFWSSFFAKKVVPAEKMINKMGTRSNYNRIIAAAIAACNKFLIDLFVKKVMER